ncbi:MAG TPA: sugar ABC transporter permease [Chloroflexota bacterium]|jgi:multiple sugar transport system permease protein|nr:sugar ABC transporter permease [Chloroflexota bacterium]
MAHRRGATLRALRRQEELTAWLFVTPVVLGILLFSVYPVLFSLYISLTDWNVLTSPRWVGPQNYVELVTTDRFFLTALANSAVYAAGTVVPGLVLALFFAVLLNQEIRGRFVYRAIYFVPVVAPTVSIAILWTWIYEPTFGVLNYALKQVGIEGPPWINSSAWAMPSLIIMTIWHGLGYSIVILLAGLQTISREYYEAAAIDGANALHRFRHVTLPLLSPVTFFVLVLSVINALQAFTSAYVLTGGGPANATLTVVLYLYQQAFQFEYMGLASAVAYCLFVIIVGLTGLNFALQRLWVFYDEGR